MPRFFKVLALAGLSACLNGCMIAGALAYKFAGPPPTPARYAPPKEPMLVLVETARTRGSAIPETAELAASLVQDLSSHEIGPIIDLDLLQRLRDANPTRYAARTITDIGRDLGARQVLYVSVGRLDFERPPGSDTIRGRIHARYRMIDVATAATRFPDDAEEEPFEYETRFQRITPEVTEAQLKRQILRESATQIGRTFYSWQAQTMTEENQDLKLR